MNKKFKLKSKSKSSNWYLAIVSVLVLISVVASGFVYWHNYTNPKTTEIDLIVEKNSDVLPVDEISTQIILPNPVPLRPPYTQQASSVGDFGNNGEFGSFAAMGYVITEKRFSGGGDTGYPPCTADTCEIVDHVSFVVTHTDNTNVPIYLGHIDGQNVWVDGNTISIGCLKGDFISYYNYSDAFGPGYHEINSTITEKLFSATESNPIKLSFQKLEYSSGHGVGGNACMSSFTTFEIND